MPDPRTAEERLRAALQAVWDLGDQLDSNHTRWTAAQVADRFGVTIEAHNRFSEPPRNRNEETIAGLEAALDECRAALAVEPVPVPLDVERLAHKAAEIGFTYGALGRDFEYVYKNVNDMLAAEYAALATPPEPEP